MPAMRAGTARSGGSLRAIPRSVWALGIVSLLMDTSSELVHSLLPVLMVSVLGASALSLGLVEGIAEATASVTKVFSGALSDRLGRRKLLAVIGYGLAAATKPLFPLASSVGWVLAARFLDRVGKGIRGAPRDALVGDIVPPHLRGTAYGLRQALDTVGAFAGPLLAVGLLALLRDDIRAVLSVAVVPAVLAVVCLMVGVREPDRHPSAEPARAPLRLAELRRLGPAYWRVVLAGGVLTLARFSEAFLVLRVQGLGLTVALVPLVLVVMNVAYALSAYPAGVLADRSSRRALLAAGLLVLITADLALAAAASVGVALVGVALWGLHMGLTQGLLATQVADASPAELRGTAFGMFNLAVGVLLLVASALAGLLWNRFGAPATFLSGAVLTALALGTVLLVGRARGGEVA